MECKDDIELSVDMIKKEIDALESSDFYLQMKDHWNNDDFHTHDVYRERIRQLKILLKDKEE